MSPPLSLLAALVVASVIGCDPSARDAPATSVPASEDASAGEVPAPVTALAVEADPWPYPWASPADPVLLACQRLEEQLEQLRALEPAKREHLQRVAREIVSNSHVHRAIVAFAFEMHEVLGELDPQELEALGLEPEDPARLAALQEGLALQVEVLAGLGLESGVSVAVLDDAGMAARTVLDDAEIARIAPAFPYSAELLLWRGEIIALKGQAQRPCDRCGEAENELRRALADELASLEERYNEVPDLGC